MKNIIQNDSLQRVEPTARAVADQTQKNLSDQIAVARSGELEREQKRTQVEDSAASRLAEDFPGGRRQPGEKRPRRGPGDEKKSGAVPREHFLGGQLLDTEG